MRSNEICFFVLLLMGLCDLKAMSQCNDGMYISPGMKAGFVKMGDTLVYLEKGEGGIVSVQAYAGSILCHDRMVIAAYNQYYHYNVVLDSSRCDPDAILFSMTGDDNPFGHRFRLIRPAGIKGDTLPISGDLQYGFLTKFPRDPHVSFKLCDAYLSEPSLSEIHDVDSWLNTNVLLEAISNVSCKTLIPIVLQWGNHYNVHFVLGSDVAYEAIDSILQLKYYPDVDEWKFVNRPGLRFVRQSKPTCEKSVVSSLRMLADVIWNRPQWEENQN